MTRLGAIVVLAILLALVAGLAWALWDTGALDIGVRSTGAIAIIAGGVSATGGLAGVLIWLAFYSARRGFDDAAGIAKSSDDPAEVGERDPKDGRAALPGQP